MTSAANRQSCDLIEVADSLGASDASGEDLECAIRQLSGDQRSCVELFYYKGLSYGEIVSATGMPYAKVKSHLQNAMRLLRIHFNQETQ